MNRRSLIQRFYSLVGLSALDSVIKKNAYANTTQNINKVNGGISRPEWFREGVGIGNSTADTEALLMCWNWVLDSSHSRSPALENDHVTMVDKSPIIELTSPSYKIEKSLSLVKGQSSLVKIRGLGRFSTRLELTKDIFLIDSDIGFVGLDLSDFHCVGGLGMLRLRSHNINVARGYLIERVHISNYKECGILSLSQDQPYFKVRDCHFIGSRDEKSIGIALCGLRAGSEIASNVFWRGSYMIKLGTSSGKGPTSPISILYNDFTRIDKNSDKINLCKAHVWIVPNKILNSNCGKGILFIGNKHGNEGIASNFSTFLIADEERDEGIYSLRHSVRNSEGFLAGVSMIKDCLNFRQDTPTPLIRSYTLNLFAFDLDPLWGSGSPTVVCEYVYSNLNILKNSHDKFLKSNFVSLQQGVSFSMGVQRPILTNGPQYWIARD